MALWMTAPLREISSFGAMWLVQGVRNVIRLHHRLSTRQAVAREAGLMVNAPSAIALSTGSALLEK